MTPSDLIAELNVDPGDDVLWHAIADALEESGEDNRAELLRLTQAALQMCEECEDRSAIQSRIIELIDAGVQPVAPEFTNSIGMRFVLIPAGYFLMGSPESEQGRSSDEGPQHLVLLTKPYYLATTPVTQSQWQQVMGSNPSWFTTDRVGEDTSDFPVERVSWDDTQAFLAKLAELPGEQGRKYRLPTEPEWERAARGGLENLPFHYGKSLASTQSNFNGNYPYGGATKGPYLQRTRKAGYYKPNAFGLYDMHGNIWEWCNDWYGSNAYQQRLGALPPEEPETPTVDPQSMEGSGRVLRGGSWYDSSRFCRSAFRSYYGPTSRIEFLGFRAAVDPQSMEGSDRVLRGGSWLSSSGLCRSAYRRSSEPTSRRRYLGFRAVVDPQSMEGSFRVSRGGSWIYSSGLCRSAYRSYYGPTDRFKCLGFRPCLPLPPEERL